MSNHVVLIALVFGFLWLLSMAGWGLHAAALRRQRQQLQQNLQTMDSRKRSQSTRYGQITEQFAPTLADWPWDPKGFRFLGHPIDGVQFTDQGVILVEIKTNNAQLSPVQRAVRDHVAAGRVYWHEHRIG